MQHTHTLEVLWHHIVMCANNWLSDFRSGGKAVGKKEIFNQCHTRLRNAIECAFGIGRISQYWREWHLIRLLLKQKLSWHASPFTIFFDKSQLWIDYFLNMAMKWNWKVFMQIKIKTQLQAVFLQHLIKNSCNNSETKSQMNSFKCLVNLSFLAFYHCKKCNV